ncbi:MAG: hypothetical protein HC883_05355, partial [Bdellovibrionaceae bacterium]|nr:hypothetical protein [Pseudobdellovibrionaceae bacterium]
MIGRGEFSGEEFIAHYPGGKWIPISQDPQFYDKLLDVISNDENKMPSEQTRVLEFTRQQHTEVSTGQEDSQEEETKPSPETYAGEETPMATASGVEIGSDQPSDKKGKSGKSKKRSRRPEDIELVDIRPQMLRQVMKKAKWPLLAAVGGLVALTIVLFSAGPKEERVHLMAPQKNQPQVSADSLKGRTRQGVGDFLKDTLDGYLRALECICECGGGQQQECRSHGLVVHDLSAIC